MAKFINQDVSVVVNSVNLSGHAFSVEVGGEKEQVDVSGFNSSGAREFLPGLRDETIVVRFLQDFAAALVDATLYPLYNNGTAIPVVIKPTSAAVSATNPSFTATCTLYTYKSLDGTLGERSETEATFKVTSGQIVRATV